MTLFLSEHDAARLGIDGATPRGKRGRTTRPDVPAAGRAQATGLTPLLVAGWNWEYRVGFGYRAYRGEADTGWQADEAAACKVAKGLA